MPEEAFNNRVDRFSPTWLAIEKHLRDEIEQLRDQLEYNNEPERTANLRGQLTNARSLLQLGKEEVTQRDF